MPDMFEPLTISIAGGAAERHVVAHAAGLGHERMPEPFGLEARLALDDVGIDVGRMLPGEPGQRAQRLELRDGGEPRGDGVTVRGPPRLDRERAVHVPHGQRRNPREQLVAPGVEQVHPPAQARPPRARDAGRPSSSPRRAAPGAGSPVARARIARAPRPAPRGPARARPRSGRSPAPARAATGGRRPGWPGPRSPLPAVPSRRPTLPSRAAPPRSLPWCPGAARSRAAVATSPGRTAHRAGRSSPPPRRGVPDLPGGRGGASAPARQPAARGPSRDRRARAARRPASPRRSWSARRTGSS